MELNAETRSVNDILTLNKKYVVPRFQREYSWGDDEVGEFWDDITQQIKVSGGKLKNEEYFIGCIVLVGDDTKPDFLIVDGQQRLTTLTLFLRAMVRELVALGEQTAADALYKNVIQGKDHDGNDYFKLINESPKPFFQNELQAIVPQNISKADSDEEMLLKNTYDFFGKRLTDYCLTGHSHLDSIKALRTQVLDYVKFIRVTAKNEEDAYTIFETLNARGLGLSSVDLIKNWIFKNYGDTHPHDNAKETWGGIRKTITAFSEFDTFFRHYWNSKYSFASDDRIYKTFKETLKDGRISNAQSFLLELKDASTIYRKIGAPAEADWPVQKEKAIYSSLALLNQYKVSQVRPFLLSLLEAHRRGLVPQQLLVKTVINLENFHFIFSNLCQDRASGLEGKYTRAAKNLYLAGNSKAKVRAVIKELMVYLRKKRPNKALIDSSLGKLVFLKGEEIDKKTIQTVFSKIEHHLLETQELKVSTLSLEHIEDQSTGKNWVGLIGNLLPLDEVLNNEIKTGATFALKCKTYQKSKFEIVKLFLKLFGSGIWDESKAKKWNDWLAGAIFKATELKAI